MNDKQGEALKAAMEAAVSPPDVLKAIARACWFDAMKKEEQLHNEIDCPAYLIPTEADMEAWLNKHPPEANADFLESDKRLQALMAKQPTNLDRWKADPRTECTINADGNEEIRTAIFTITRSGNFTQEIPQWKLTTHLETEVWEGIFGHKETANIATVHRVWKQNSHPLPSHPLTPLIKAWQRNQPRPVAYNNRPDRILPSRLGMTDKQDKTSLKLFSPAAHASPDGQQVLVGFEQEVHTPVLPLALYDLGVGKDAPGPGAPLPLRIWISAILSVPLEDRAGDGVIIAPTMREFLAALYPMRLPRPNEYLPMLIRAADALASYKARIPWHNHLTGKGGLRSVVTIVDIPTGKRLQDERIKIRVDLPPGAKAGPIIPDSLPLWGVSSGTAYRALIGLAYLWHKPGVTHHPVRRGQYWLPSNDPNNYPKLSDAQLISLCFPTGIIGR